MTHFELIQEILHDLATRRLETYAQGFVLDVGPQTLCIDFYRRLKQAKTS